MRLDQELVLRNLYPSRAKAVAAINGGLVSVNGVIAKKPSQVVNDSDEITGGALPYSVGRGSLKLAHALDYFNVLPADMVCLDVGASTGGFTQELLSRGAKRVYAVDVGTNQLADELRNDSRVVSLEKTDIRDLPPISSVDLIVIDVSFISLTNIVEFLGPWGAKTVIALIKPQFEVPRNIAYHSFLNLAKIDQNKPTSSGGYRCSGSQTGRNYYIYVEAEDRMGNTISKTDKVLGQVYIMVNGYYSLSN